MPSLFGVSKPMPQRFGGPSPLSRLAAQLVDDVDEPGDMKPPSRFSGASMSRLLTGPRRGTPREDELAKTAPGLRPSAEVAATEDRLTRLFESERRERRAAFDAARAELAAQQSALVETFERADRGDQDARDSSVPSRFSEALKEGQAGAPRPLSRYATEPGTFGVRAEQRASGSGPWSRVGSPHPASAAVARSRPGSQTPAGTGGSATARVADASDVGAQAGVLLRQELESLRAEHMRMVDEMARSLRQEIVTIHMELERTNSKLEAGRQPAPDDEALMKRFDAIEARLRETATGQLAADRGPDASLLYDQQRKMDQRLAEMSSKLDEKHAVTEAALHDLHAEHAAELDKHRIAIRDLGQRQKSPSKPSSPSKGEELAALQRELRDRHASIDEGLSDQAEAIEAQRKQLVELQRQLAQRPVPSESELFGEAQEKRAQAAEVADLRRSLEALQDMLGAETRAREELEGAVGVERQARKELEGTVSAERRAREELEGAVSSERRGREELKGVVGAERRSREELEGSLRAERRSREELEGALSEEREAREALEGSVRGLSAAPAAPAAGPAEAAQATEVAALQRSSQELAHAVEMHREMLTALEQEAGSAADELRELRDLVARGARPGSPQQLAQEIEIALADAGSPGSPSSLAAAGPDPRDLVRLIEAEREARLDLSRALEAERSASVKQADRLVELSQLLDGELEAREALSRDMQAQQELLSALGQEAGSAAGAAEQLEGAAEQLEQRSVQLRRELLEAAEVEAAAREGEVAELRASLAEFRRQLAAVGGEAGDAAEAAGVREEVAELRASLGEFRRQLAAVGGEAGDAAEAAGVLEEALRDRLTGAEAAARAAGRKATSLADELNLAVEELRGEMSRLEQELGRAARGAVVAPGPGVGSGSAEALTAHMDELGAHVDTIAEKLTARMEALAGSVEEQLAARPGSPSADVAPPRGALALASDSAEAASFEAAALDLRSLEERLQGEIAAVRATLEESVATVVQEEVGKATPALEQRLRARLDLMAASGKFAQSPSRPGTPGPMSPPRSGSPGGSPDKGPPLAEEVERLGTALKSQEDDLAQLRAGQRRGLTRLEGTVEVLQADYDETKAAVGQLTEKLAKEVQERRDEAESLRASVARSALHQVERPEAEALPEASRPRSELDQILETRRRLTEGDRRGRSPPRVLDDDTGAGVGLDSGASSPLGQARGGDSDLPGRSSLGSQLTSASEVRSRGPVTVDVDFGDVDQEDRSLSRRQARTSTWRSGVSTEGGEVSRKTSKEKAQVRRVDFIRKALGRPMREGLAVAVYNGPPLPDQKLRVMMVCHALNPERPMWGQTFQPRAGSSLSPDRFTEGQSDDDEDLELDPTAPASVTAPSWLVQKVQRSISKTPTRANAALVEHVLDLTEEVQQVRVNLVRMALTGRSDLNVEDLLRAAPRPRPPGVDRSASKPQPPQASLEELQALGEEGREIMQQQFCTGLVRLKSQVDALYDVRMV